MKRTLAAAILICAGCASTDSDPADRRLWDVRSLFSTGYDEDAASVPRKAPSVPLSALAPPAATSSTTSPPASAQ